ncbi:MAG TPA: class I SAM-dependent methyltransferase [Anaerolineaceae bacterium]
MSEASTTEQVRQFYDQVGWQVTREGLYQNARYEDLRPVAQEYIHRCHLRVNRHLKPSGRYLLDAGSGPVQYPEYLTYSEHYHYRVCLDLSHVALEEARARLGDKGLYVVADVANLPFAPGVFEGVVSLHTFHHLPAGTQPRAYQEVHRVLAEGSHAVIVNGWTEAPLMRRLAWLVNLAERLGKRLRRKTQVIQPEVQAEQGTNPVKTAPTGTFVQKIDANWLERELASQMHLEIYPWRSINVRFMRALVHQKLAGKAFLRLLFWLEERFPRWFARNGQYPLVVIYK